MSITELESLMVLRDLGRLSKRFQQRARLEENLQKLRGVEVRAGAKGSTAASRAETPPDAMELFETFSFLDTPCRSLLTLLAPSGVLFFSSEMRAADALRFMKEEGQQYALVQSTPNSIAGVFSPFSVKEHLKVRERQERLEADGRPSGPVSQYVSTKFVVESSLATVWEVVERMTVAKVITLLLVDERGRPEAVLDPSRILSVLSSGECSIGAITEYSRKALVSRRSSAC